MNKSTSMLNVGQAAIAAAKLVLFFVLPMIAINLPVVGEIFRMKGMDLYNQLHVDLCIFMMIAYALMLVCSFGPLQTFSFVPALAALVMEIIVMANPSGIVPIKELLAWVTTMIPAEYVSYVQVGEQVLKQFIRPGIGVTITMILTLVYALFQFFPVLSIGGSTGGSMGGSTGGNRGGSSSGSIPRRV